MPYPVFPEAVNLEYPQNRAPKWRTLINASEGEVEQRVGKMTRPVETWDCVANLMPRSEEADVLSNFNARRKGAYEPFLFKAKAPRNYEMLYIGIGDGTRRVWQMPVYGWTFLTVYVDGVEKTRGVDYDIIVGAGNAQTDLIAFRTAPTNGAFAECDATDAFQIVLARFGSDIYEEDCQRYGRFAARFSLVQVKGDIDPYADGKTLLMPLIGADQSALLRMDKGTGAATFNRANAATYRGSDGLLKVVPQDVLREDWAPGKNLIPCSENIASPYWTKGNGVIIESDALAPNGQYVASVFRATSADGYLWSSYAMVRSSAYYTFSVWLRVRSGSLSVNLTQTKGGRVTLASSSKTVTTQWQRFSITAQADSTGENISGQIGGLSTLPSGSTLEIWGAQIEAGSSATRYEKTLTSILVSHGTLIEETSTNKLLYSEQFDNAAWSVAGSLGVTPNTGETVDPAGGNGADILDDPGGALAAIYNTTGIAIVAEAGSHAGSVFIKKKTSRFACVRISYSGGTAQNGDIVIDLDTGAILAGSGSAHSWANVEYWGNGWYRLSVAMDNNATNTFGWLSVFPAWASALQAANDPAATGSVYVWGAQFEDWFVSTSYIPTTAATVTRGEDIISLPSASNVSGTVGSGACTFDPPPAMYVSAILCDATVNRQVMLILQTQLQSFDGTDTVNDVAAVWGYNTRRACFRWGNGSRSCLRDGGLIASGAFDGDLDLSASLHIGRLQNTYGFGSRLKHLVVWNRSLNESEMQGVVA